MAEIAVLHWDIAAGGGAESLCMHVLEALQDDHELSLLTRQEAHLDDLNRYYGTAVSGINIEVPSIAGREFESTIPLIRQIKGGRLGFLRPLRFTLFHAACRSRSRQADLVFNTYSEMATSQPSIQYVHYPQYNRSRNGLENIPKSRLHNILDGLVTALGGPDLPSPSSTILTNSEWTANLFETVHDVEPTVVYPPIRTEEFSESVPISEQESGFLVIGRVLEGKGQLQAIETVRRLRERGHDVHLHIIGPPTNPDYVAEIEDTARESDFVAYEGQLPREELVQMLQRHRYGLHTMPNEHFGMVVAEMVAADSLPFVPNRGGQCEIVDHQEDLLYRDVNATVEQIDRVLSNPEYERQLRESLPNVEPRYGVPRFKKRIRSIVDDKLNSTS